MWLRPRDWLRCTWPTLIWTSVEQCERLRAPLPPTLAPAASSEFLFHWQILPGLAALPWFICSRTEETSCQGLRGEGGRERDRLTWCQ